MDKLEYWIWLSRLLNVKNIILRNLLEKYKTPKELWKLNEKDLAKENIEQEDINKILNVDLRRNLDKYLECIRKNQIKIVTYMDDIYPRKLKQIYDSPLVLYVKGNEKILNDMSIAIVGCRNCSQYGKNVTEKISYQLARNDINIISGLARGIDTFAHIGALKAKAKTIAVMGSGHDKIYPAENRGIYEKIIETGGAVVSEYIIGTSPEKMNFPRRNRIISGLSNGVLVVEAKERSGSLITVDFALEQGKEVYAIPGDINKLNSFGTNKLIQEGAKLVLDVRDILEELYIYT